MRIFLAAIALSVITTPSMAQDRRDDGQTVKVLERDERGRATKVEVGGQVYSVCMNENQDSCIQPRQAGLNWGPRPASRFPASKNGRSSN